jgi:hypothetical protein
MRSCFQQWKSQVRQVRFPGLITLSFAAITLMPLAAAGANVPPPTPAAITPPAGNIAFLVGNAVGTQGYVCLPTATGAS